MGRGGDNPDALVARRDRRPVKPLAFYAHDGRELGPDDMELVPSKRPRPPRRT